MLGISRYNTSQEYKDYMLSDEWKRKRAERLRLDHYTCQMCGAKQNRVEPLEVHHLYYKDKQGNDLLGRENVNKQLVSLCPICHRHLHNLYNRPIR